MTLIDVARRNLESLRHNPYPGRGIVVGIDQSGRHMVQVYWIMGRSANSRNRVFVAENGAWLRTAPADPNNIQDPSLIIYNAMVLGTNDWDARCRFHVVSNGSQTDDVKIHVEHAWSLPRSLERFTFEPDAPNFTPRITAVSFSYERPTKMQIAILRQSPWDLGCDRHFYGYSDIGQGFGYCITTYMGDGDPLPSFQGEPYLLPLEGDAEAIAQTIWAALNEENRVSLAVKFIDKRSAESTIHVINKYTQVSAE